MAGTASGSTSTDSSHTLLGDSVKPSPTMDSTSASINPRSGLAAPLLNALSSDHRYTFLQPTAALPTASLAVAKETLDNIASQVADEQTERIKAAPKRKRGEEKVETLKIRKVFVDGFETGQVWQQAKRIVAAALREGEEVLAELERGGEIDGVEKEEEDESSEEEEVVGGSGTDLSGEEGSEVLSGEEDEEEEEEDEDEEMADGEDIEADDSDNFDIDHDDYDEEEEGLGLEDGEDEDEDDEELDEPTGEFVADPNGLNDGFFDINEFNKQSQYFEQQDARADPNTDVASDDEELDWHQDPMAAVPGKGKQSKKSSKDDDEMADMDDDEADEEDGPTFGDMDLDAPEGASDDEDEDAGNLADGLDGALDLNANDVFYKDFFAPPARKAKTGNQRKGGDYIPKAKRAPQVEEGDVERAMNNVARDLFDDLSEQEDSDDALSDVSAGDPKSRRSAHERRQAKLAEEIRKLEAEAVAKRDWTLSGETTGTERPINSLLEQDLAFEHVGKPVPIITEEVSESIESLIKRRILAQEFDELVRRRPGADDMSSDRRRGMIELDDTKNKQSLAEIYEEEHVKNSNPDTYISKADEKLQKEEKEVENLWKDVCARLDALSSWHYKPKPAAPSLTVVADVATIAMEDAQPATAQGVMGGDSALAPQEIYKAGKETVETGEVVAGGLPVARQEMSREDKLRRRRREKERIRKSGGDGKNGEKDKGVSKKSKEKRDTMEQLKKGGVRVINRKGEVVDVDGNKAKETRAATSGSFKL